MLNDKPQKLEFDGSNRTLNDYVDLGGLDCLQLEDDEELVTDGGQDIEDGGMFDADDFSVGDRFDGPDNSRLEITDEHAGVLIIEEYDNHGEPVANQSIRAHGLAFKLNQDGYERMHTVDRDELPLGGDEEGDR